MEFSQAKSILITGGTGSFGIAFVKRLLSDFQNFERIIIYSRDELKQYEMSQAFSGELGKKLRFFIGDVRDKTRLLYAMSGVDFVVHAAALKQVPAAEYNPFEAVKTNILGAQNVIESAIESKVKKVVALSTDKAAAPINLYGATKLCSDKLFIAANLFKGRENCIFSVVRYGNVMGSRGSVIPLFQKQKLNGFLTITDANMTRFSITLEEGVNFVFFALQKMVGGEIFVPKIPSYKILDVAKAIAPNCEVKISGIRPGEKLHEEMITEMDSLNAIEFENHFVLLPSFDPNWPLKEILLRENGKQCEKQFRYNSGENTQWLSVEQIKNLIATKIP